MKLRRKLMLAPVLSALLLALCLSISVWLLICLQTGSRASHEQINAANRTLIITGIGTIDDRMLILIEIEALMSSGEMGLNETAL